MDQQQEAERTSTTYGVEEWYQYGKEPGMWALGSKGLLTIEDARKQAARSQANEFRKNVGIRIVKVVATTEVVELVEPHEEKRRA